MANVLLRGFTAGSPVEEKINTALRMLRLEGHTIFPIVVNGRLDFEIDGEIHASCDEMADLADGIYTLAEFLEAQARHLAVVSKAVVW